MARIRTIKPQFWDDAKIGQISRNARLLYIGLWTFADDLGVVIADPVWLKSKIFPYDRIQVQQLKAWLSELEKTGFISLLSDFSESFYYLPTFSRHQVINKPNFDNVNIRKELLDRVLAPIPERSVINTGTITERSVPIIGEEKERNNSTPYNPPKGETGLINAPGETGMGGIHDDVAKGTEPSKSPDAAPEKSCAKKAPRKGCAEKRPRAALDTSAVEPSFQPIVADWLDYKSERGQTYRQRGFDCFYSQIRKLSGGDAGRAREIIQQSMANNWAGIFPLKTTNDYERSAKNQPPSPDELARAVAAGISRAHTRQEWE